MEGGGKKVKSKENNKNKLLAKERRGGYFWWLLTLALLLFGSVCRRRMWELRPALLLHDLRHVWHVKVGLCGVWVGVGCFVLWRARV